MPLFPSRRIFLAGLPALALGAYRPNASLGAPRTSDALQPIGTLRPAEFLTGINFSGLSYEPWSQWPLAAAADYFCNVKKMNVVRLCWAWEIAQPILNGPLDAKQVAGIEDQIARITGAGAWVVLELHNYGRRHEGDTDYIVGETTKVTSAHFADVWSKIATQWKNRERVIFELTNEPHDQDIKTLVRVSNEAIAAIRTAGASNMIMLCANNWNAYGWRRGSANLTYMLDIVDPLDHFVFDVHQYFDEWGAGKTTNVVAGWDAGLISFTNWARKNGKKGFCGEFGTPATAAGNTALRSFLSFLKDNHDVWIGWAWWGGGGWWQYDYLFRLDPYASKWEKANPFAARAENWSAPLIDMPQMTILDAYLPIVPPTNYVLKSRDFTSSFWSRGPWGFLDCTIEMGAANGVFGPLSAAAFREGASAGQHGIEQSGLKIQAGAPLTLSVISKAGHRGRVQISLLSQDASSAIHGIFDVGKGLYESGFANGSGIMTRHEITPLGDGFHLIEFSGTLDKISTQALIRVQARDDSDSDHYRGHPAEVAYYLDHVQLESGSIAHPPKINL
jgi:endoglucanase